MRTSDGLRYPSIDELLTKVDSKYKLVYVSSKRAKLIEKENHVAVAPKCHKAVGQALEEVLEEKINVEFEELKNLKR